MFQKIGWLLQKKKEDKKDKIKISKLFIKNRIINYYKNVIIINYWNIMFLII